MNYKNMSNKNLRLLIILIILSAFAFLYSGPIKEWKREAKKPENFLAKLNLEEIDRIEISKLGSESILLRENEKWKVKVDGDFYVSSSLAGNISKAMNDAGESDLVLVSSNLGKKNEFKTDVSGIRVKFYQADDLKSDFIIGNLGPDFFSTYISKEDIDDTYIAKANLFGAFSVGDWRDKTIFSSNQNDISKLRFQYPNREFEIEKRNEDWFSGSQELDKNKVSEVLALMANLSAISIPEQNFANTGLEKNLLIVEASGNNLNNVIMIGEANANNQHYAKRGDSDNIYLITEEQRDKLNKSINDFR
jgi:hypothetical protein